LTGSDEANTIVDTGKDDVIEAGDGADDLTGGAGADTFKFSAVGSNGTDSINNFDDATNGTDDDIMDFSGLGTVFDGAAFDAAGAAYNSTYVSVVGDSTDGLGAVDLVVDTGTVADLATLEDNLAAETGVSGEMLVIINVTDYDSNTAGNQTGIVIAHDDDVTSDSNRANISLLGVVGLESGVGLADLTAANFA